MKGAEHFRNAELAVEEYLVQIEEIDKSFEDDDDEDVKQRIVQRMKLILQLLTYAQVEAALAETAGAMDRWLIDRDRPTGETVGRLRAWQEALK